MSLLFLFIIFVGISRWVPSLKTESQPDLVERHNWFGSKFLFAQLVLPIILYVGNVILNIPLSWLAGIYVVVGGIGLLVLAYENRVLRKINRSILAHPVWVLATLTLLVVSYEGGIEYLPIAGDEAGSWLYYAQEIFQADAFWSDQMKYAHLSYTNGWPMMVAFANSLFFEFDESHASSLPFLLHVGVLGFTFDIVKHNVEMRYENLKSNAGTIAWLVVLALLTVEASWVLYPTLLLIEKPLIYAFIICFLIGLLGQNQSFDRRQLSGFLGIAFATGFLFKITMMSFGPILGVIWLSFLQNEYRNLQKQKKVASVFDLNFVSIGIDMAARMLVPFVVVSISWSYFKIGHECNASVVSLLDISDTEHLNALKISALALSDILSSYLTNFKPIVSLIGLGGLLVALAWKRTRWIGWGLLIFSGLYLFALNAAYTTCQPFSEPGEIQSAQRYFRTNLRVLHYFGFLILALSLLEIKIVNRLASNFLSSAVGTKIGLMAIVLLLAFQTVSVKESLNHIRLRTDQNVQTRTVLTQMKQEAQVFKAVLTKRKLEDPSVALVVEGSPDEEYVLARYYGLKKQRDAAYRHYHIGTKDIWKTGYRQSNFDWGGEDAKRSQMIEWFIKFDVIWPTASDENFKNTVLILTGDSKCAEESQKYFLFREGENKFTCVSKF